MNARKLIVAVLAIAVGVSLLGVAQAAGTGSVRAGVASSDISWHVGAGQGQYGSEGNTLTSNKFDPYVHGSKMTPSDGIQGRLYARALVVEGPDGTRVAYVKHDLYLQQDLLHRRVSQLVEDAGVGLDGEHIMIGATHNHSAPYFATEAWGVWLFTDTFDYRQFDYLAHRLAEAVIDAAGDLRPVRMGASVVHLDEVQQNILGPGTADDGSPAGFPRDHFDSELSVVRFDDISGDEPEPLAALVNLGMHPESLATADMYSPDFVGQVQRMVERRVGATVVWSQGSVGDVEPDQNARAHPPAQKREYWHRDHAQAERMGRIVAERVIDGWNDVAATEHEVPTKHVPFSSEFPVSMIDARFAGPTAHPLPTYGNCRVDPIAVNGHVRVPGLPTCESEQLPLGPGVPTEALRSAGVPIPDQYAWTARGGVQESFRAHLQVMRLGDVALASCPCEPISDMTRNFKSRADASAGNIADGFDWPCRETGGGWECNFATAAYKPDNWKPVAAEAVALMRAQVHNDAAGWEELAYAQNQESEPNDIEAIKGNYTKQEIQTLCGSCTGYRLPLMVGQANDYVGYIVTYREYQSHDHYRKALTAWGPHSSDFVNTRLVHMAARLQGSTTALPSSPWDPAVAAEEPEKDAELALIGQGAAAARAAYEAAIPDDGETPSITDEPADLERFGAAQVRWWGGSNYTDQPLVVVERFDGESWSTFATQEGGEIVVTFAYAETLDPEAVARWGAGQLEHLWTATFEVFDDTPAGTYRYSIKGEHRTNRAQTPYTLISREFQVAPWDGIAVTGGSYSGGVARFTVAPIDYPDTYPAVGVPYLSTSITNTDTGSYCLRCTFRPWSATGSVASAFVTVRSDDGSSVVRYPAAFDGTEWVASGIVAGPGDDVVVEVGDVSDSFGNVNGEALGIGEGS